jgi:hypothetical protein
VRAIIWGLSIRLSLIVTAPARVPAAVGVNVTLIMQAAPGAMAAGHVLLAEKSPLAVITGVAIGAGVPFVKVTT